jgi:hypothetical protein
LLTSSIATASTTVKGFVLADIIPRIFGIFASAVPSAQLATNLPETETTSLPPSISLSMVAVVPSRSNF